MIPFEKMHGIGNDFVMVDGISEPKPLSEWARLAVPMCDRRFGIGSDGLIIAEKSEDADFRMVMFNPDGSESEMCGNGIRCFALYLRKLGLTQAEEISVETGAGVLRVTIQGDLVRVYMGKANFSTKQIPMNTDVEEFVDQPIEAGDKAFNATAVSTGNPHVVIFVDDLDEVDLASLGPSIEHNPLFPNRTNVHFVSAQGRNSLKMKTWERGAGATLACGTGACAVTAAAVKTGRSERSVDVALPGGGLQIEYHENGDLFKTGPAKFVCSGEYFDEPAS